MVKLSLGLTPFVLMFFSGMSWPFIGNTQQLKPQVSVDAVGTFLSAFIQKYNIPGANVAVSHGGKIVYQKGLGLANVEANAPVVATTPFRIASISKPLTAVAIFKMLENSGQDIATALDKPVFGDQGYLPEYKDIQDPRVYQIRLRDLLQHTGGWDSRNYDPQFDLYNIATTMGTTPPADAKTVVSYMLKYYQLDVDPGKEFHYSNFGYNILGRVIEAQTGMPYDEYVKAQVLAPTGITAMQIGGSRLQDLLPNESRYYDDPRMPPVKSIYDNVTLGPQAYVGFSMPTMDSHGGWIATPTELIKFVNAVTPGSGVPLILKEETIQLMTTPITGIGNDQASLGWVSTKGGQEISHSGALESSTLTYLIRRADGNAWSVTFNRLPATNMDEIGQLMQELLSNMDMIVGSIDEWPQ